MYDLLERSESNEGFNFGLKLTSLKILDLCFDRVKTDLRLFVLTQTVFEVERDTKIRRHIKLHVIYVGLYSGEFIRRDVITVKEIILDQNLIKREETIYGKILIN